MKRIDALRAIVETTADVPVIATCAATSRELAAVEDRDNHLYLLDAMGLAVSVGTGIAQASTPTRKPNTPEFNSRRQMLAHSGPQPEGSRGA